ncbi:baseplate J/gp47 family protein [Leptothoe spongobia]|uniref:Baseplate J/gp47 family protein n=1 Tax=Leptothoe spongobia TAU-MAC 1115 TaxID=1967444 RepID=A0A947DCD1_9CYAN|nr:baseplate J/gp47 family protein [Leptothoe spongobia]MBT9314475.1 baseplate J/gp47 family protein [Leptothoe spongobia TAU-MAC 1115]
MELKAHNFRDGTGQRQRLLRALQPDYVAVDERTLEDGLRFAQTYAKQLGYFNLSNQLDGDWSGFFSGDIQQMLDYLEHSDDVTDDDPSVSPHLALFLTFLKLFQYPQQQFKELTQRYLDFYYRDVLRLTERPAIADQVHVIFGLDPGETIHLLQQGTRLSAGPDSQGVDQQYLLDEDIYLNQAQVASVKTLAVDKAYIDLKAIHLQGDRNSEAFENMLQWAVGTPNQGDALPNYPSGEPEDIPYDGAHVRSLFQSIKGYTLDQVTAPQQQYILNQLCFASIEDFQYCLDIHDREIQKQQGDREATPPMDSEWDQVYELVEKAYRKKINRDRKLTLKAEHRSPTYTNPDIAFTAMVQLALGDPNPRDALPLLPDGGQITLANLLAALAPDSTAPITPQTAAQYIQDQLFMSVEDFQTIMEINANEDAAETDWEEVYRLLEKAQSKKRGFTYPLIGRMEIQAISAAGIAEAEPGEFAQLKRFNTFSANLPEADVPATVPQDIGVAITSPVLLLSEGTREITVTLSCQAETFNRGILTDMVERGEIPFEVAISSAQEWLSMAGAALTFQVGDFLLEEPLKVHQPDGLSPVYTTPPEVMFEDEDEGRYLHFRDGTLYEITEVRAADEVKLEAVGQLAPTEQIAKYQTLEIDGSYHEITGLTLSDDGRSVSTTANRFKANDVNKFLMLADGTIYQIRRYANARNVEVNYWGYLPPVDNVIKKYDEITLTSLATIAALDMSSVVISADEDIRFAAADVGHYLAWNTGNIYQITATLSDREAQVKQVGSMQKDSVWTEPIHHYSATGIYPNSLKFSFTVEADQVAIAPPPPDKSASTFTTPYPVVKIALKGPEPSKNKGNIAAHYEALQGLCLERVNLQVAAKDIQTLQLRNDRSTLSTKSPFEPFGSSPKAGAGFYFYHPEIAYKKLDDLSLHIDWMGLPDDLAENYRAYCNVALANAPDNIENNSFQAQLQLLLNRSWRQVKTQPLFVLADDDVQGSGDSSPLAPQMTLDYGKASFEAIANYTQTAPENFTLDDLLEQPRYFKLELSSPDFLHNLYPLVLNKVARSTDTAINSLAVYPPYTPEIKAISLDYKASVEIDLSASPPEHALDQIFQLHPFGYVDIFRTCGDDDGHFFLLPQYDLAGELFIGVRDLQPPQLLTVLFQMVAGSADVELSNPPIQWSYLSCDRWYPLQDTEVLSDNTNGLVDSGIFRFQIPAEATADNHLLPGGLHWLRATVADNATAIPDTLDIRAQAVKATFVNQGNAPDHFNQPLAAKSIQTLVERVPVIQTIEQPYSSFKGRGQEAPEAFYTRVSERLRHKQRALTRWDYEHLVLENFPQIYKAKCLSQADQNNVPGAAQVTVVVIPDISNTAPFFPLEPKAPLYLLKEIETFLQAHTSPFVNVVVKNPRYEQIKYRIGVRLREGYEQGYYLQQINQELVQFLSPWAYEKQADISFGSSIHSSTVIHFVETRPYVDYVTNLKLIEQSFVDEDQQDSATLQVNTTNLAQVRRPDSILVSAPTHIIDIITTEDYEEEAFEGIDYMIIDLDFILK